MVEFARVTMVTWRASAKMLCLGAEQVDFFLLAPRGASNWERERRQLLLKRRNQVLSLGETEDVLPLELTTPYIRCWVRIPHSSWKFLLLSIFFPPYVFLLSFWVAFFCVLCRTECANVQEVQNVQNVQE